MLDWRSRAREPSTQSGIATLLILVGVRDTEAGALAGAIAGIFALLAIFLPETANKPDPPVPT